MELKNETVKQSISYFTFKTQYLYLKKNAHTKWASTSCSHQREHS